MRALAVLATLVLAIGGCVHRRGLHAPEDVRGSGGGARFHMQDGSLNSMEVWALRDGTITGVGVEYDADRVTVREGSLVFRIDDVVVVETSSRKTAGVLPLAFMTVVTVAIGVACAMSPKSCFGSCPTFYVPSGHDWVLQAEGFSSSVARVLEADDIDDLPAAHAVDGMVTVAMRNEAFETHAIRRLELLVVDGPPGSTVVQLVPDWFAALTPPQSADGCHPADACAIVADVDGAELALGSDGVDLAARESITLTYPAPGASSAALVVTARNTLMTTYLLYHLLALHGRSAGALLARLERRDTEVVGAILRWGLALGGGLDVETRQRGGAWRRAGALGYVGPIAREQRALVFAVDDPHAPVEVRVTFARADWRIDSLRVGAVIDAKLAAAAVPAVVVLAGRHHGAAVEASLRGDGARLVTLPGDEIVVEFAVPLATEADGTRGFFLHSRGYYYEWMREEWLKDEDPALARRYLLDPARALRELAPAYRLVEPEMDRIFEASRFR